jgi:hypothetical protein
MLHNVGARIFAGDQYAGLSETCLYCIGGIIKHDKRLVLGCEAPVMTTHPVEYDMYYSVPNQRENPMNIAKRRAGES